MADNVIAIDALLADGTRHRFGALADTLGADMPAGIVDLVRGLCALGAAEARRTPAALRADTPVVGLEPSCPHSPRCGRCRDLR